MLEWKYEGNGRWTAESDVPLDDEPTWKLDVTESGIFSADRTCRELTGDLILNAKSLREAQLWCRCREYELLLEIATKQTNEPRKVTWCPVLLLDSGELCATSVHDDRRQAVLAGRLQAGDDTGRFVGLMRCETFGDTEMVLLEPVGIEE